VIEKVEEYALEVVSVETIPVCKPSGMGIDGRTHLRALNRVIHASYSSIDIEDGKKDSNVWNFFIIGGVVRFNDCGCGIGCV